MSISVQLRELYKEIIQLNYFKFYNFSYFYSIQIMFRPFNSSAIQRLLLNFVITSSEKNFTCKKLLCIFNLNIRFF
jgi:hypothetical protein